MGVEGWVPVLASVGLSTLAVLPGLVVVASTAFLLPFSDAALLVLSWLNNGVVLPLPLLTFGSAKNS